LPLIFIESVVAQFFEVLRPALECVRRKVEPEEETSGGRKDKKKKKEALQAGVTWIDLCNQGTEAEG